MATLVLTAVGTAIGGPIGGAVGAIIGQQIDQVIFAPKGRQGPRLGDLSVQTSRYGTAIPKIFGAMRASGTVIWSTDLIERRASQSNGKGRARTETYSYSASFAVALSARPVLRVGRIWADGNLLRGAGGDFKTPTGFRLLTGSEDQEIDPLIAAAEGQGATPAYRGCALAVFEDFQLADYGNRIPTLSFEIIADENALSVAAILDEVSAGAIKGTGPALIDGIAVQGDSVRGVAAALTAALPVSLRDDGAALRIVEGDGVQRMLDPDDFGADAVRLTDERSAAARIPETLSIAYYDRARDYQPGVQRARREGGSRREDRIDLAATLPAGVAKRIAEARLASLWRERRTVRVSLPWRAMDIRPGDRVTLGAGGDVWRVVRVAFEKMAVRLELLPGATVPLTIGSADAGRITAQADLVHGATTLVVLDLPPLGDIAASEAQVVVAANGASAGWRRAPLLGSGDGGASFIEIGATAFPATMGVAETALAAGDAWLIDHINSVDVVLVNPTLTLSDADDDALAAGANLAMIGREAVQFERAVPLGGARWRLSQLWRGRRGTERAIDGHVACEAFVLLDATTLAKLPVALAVSRVRVMAAGIGDGPGGVATLAGAGSAMKPLAPVALKALRADGDIFVSWTRRSREGWRWADGVEAPLGEEREAYRVTRTATGATTLSFETAVPGWTYPAALIDADIAGGATGATIFVEQIGSRAVSPPASIFVSLS